MKSQVLIMLFGLYAHSNELATSESNASGSTLACSPVVQQIAEAEKEHRITLGSWFHIEGRESCVRSMKRGMETLKYGKKDFDNSQDAVDQFRKRYESFGSDVHDAAKACIHRGDVEEEKYLVSKIYYSLAKLENNQQQVLAQTQAIDILLSTSTTKELCESAKMPGITAQCEKLANACKNTPSDLEAIASETEQVMTYIAEIDKAIAEIYDSGTLGFISAEKKAQVEKLEIAKEGLTTNFPWIAGDAFKKARDKGYGIKSAVMEQIRATRGLLVENYNKGNSAINCIKSDKENRNCDFNEIKNFIYKAPDVPDQYTGDRNFNLTANYLNIQRCSIDNNDSKDGADKIAADFAIDAGLTIFTGGVVALARVAGAGSKAALSFSRLEKAALATDIAVGGVRAKDIYDKECGPFLTNIQNAPSEANQCPTFDSYSSQNSRAYGVCMTKVLLTGLLPMAPFISKAIPKRLPKESPPVPRNAPATSGNPRLDAPKADAPVARANPKAEAPKVEAPKAEAPQAKPGAAGSASSRPWSAKFKRAYDEMNAPEVTFNIGGTTKTGKIKTNSNGVIEIVDENGAVVILRGKDADALRAKYGLDPKPGAAKPDVETPMPGASRNGEKVDVPPGMNARRWKTPTESASGYNSFRNSYESGSFVGDKKLVALTDSKGNRTFFEIKGKNADGSLNVRDTVSGKESVLKNADLDNVRHLDDKLKSEMAQRIDDVGRSANGSARASANADASARSAKAGEEAASASAKVPPKAPIGQRIRDSVSSGVQKAKNKVNDIRARAAARKQADFDRRWGTAPNRFTENYNEFRRAYDSGKFTDANKYVSFNRGGDQIPGRINRKFRDGSIEVEDIFGNVTKLKGDQLRSIRVSSSTPKATFEARALEIRNTRAKMDAEAKVAAQKKADYEKRWGDVPNQSRATDYESFRRAYDSNSFDDANRYVSYNAGSFQKQVVIRSKQADGSLEIEDIYGIRSIIRGDQLKSVRVSERGKKTFGDNVAEVNRAKAAEEVRKTAEANYAKRWGRPASGSRAADYESFRRAYDSDSFDDLNRYVSYDTGSFQKAVVIRRKLSDGSLEVEDILGIKTIIRGDQLKSIRVSSRGKKGFEDEIAELNRTKAAEEARQAAAAAARRQAEEAAQASRRAAADQAAAAAKIKTDPELVQGLSEAENFRRSFSSLSTQAKIEGTRRYLQKLNFNRPRDMSPSDKEKIEEIVRWLIVEKRNLRGKE